MKFLTTIVTICLMTIGLSVATAQTKVTFTSKVPASETLVLGVYKGGLLGDQVTAIDKASRGAISHAIQVTGFSGEIMETSVIPGPMNTPYKQLMLIGLGQKDSGLSAFDLQKIGGMAAQKSVTAFGTAAPIILDLPGVTAAHIGFGAKLGSYYFDKYYTYAENKKSQARVTIVTKTANDSEAYYKDHLHSVADGIWFARDISNEPANVIYPESFVDRWAQHFEGMENVTVKVYDDKKIKAMGMGAFYGVGQGSDRPSRMMVVEYMGGDKGDKPVVIAGKGITFDTGGISLKNPTNMWNMKFDMSGAASALGTLYGVAGRGAKVNAVAIVALAENMASSKAQRPGDVVKTMSGLTVQIRSTDAEGRLVLADALYYADMKYDPKVLINLATLTGSARRALGGDYAALFSRHDDLAASLITASKQSGEGAWHLPLNDNHFAAIRNNVADIMNSGPTAPGASAGAAFLGSFVRETTRWAHFDIAGIAYTDKETPLKASPGSRGYGIRLLNAYIKENHEGK